MFKIRECKKLMKKCKVCGELKRISDFYKDNGKKDGYKSQCKVCTRNKAESRYLLVCLECGKEFTSKNKKQKFCSAECSKKSQCNKEEVLCDYCGKIIKLKKSRIKRTNHHFCNNECYKKWNSDENNPLYNSEEVLCEYCKKPIKRAKSLIERRSRHFCSQECYSKWNTGENSSSWNPNLTDEERENGRNIEGYSRWIKEVYKRDNYTCQCCGDNKGHNLNAHHLKSYHWDKEHRTDIKNGITLCESCHKLFHKLYGYKNNTKEQFEEFKQRYINKEFEEVV